MNRFEHTLTEVFVNGAEERFADAAVERAAIEAAKAGDEAATLALIYAYAPTLRRGASRYRETLGEEAQQVAVTGLLEAAHAFDPQKCERLAAIVWEYVVDTLQETAGNTTGITVPTRTLKRFFGILRRADGDVDRAAELAPQFDLSRDAFFAILDAVRVEGLLPEEGEESAPAPAVRPIWGEGSPVADVEDRILVETAFDAVDVQEGDVCRLAYGFADYDPVPDAEIGHRLGLSRPKVQRTRSRALGKMRDALGL